jgi:hypothetical protein
MMRAVAITTRAAAPTSRSCTVASWAAPAKITMEVA